MTTPDAFMPAAASAPATRLSATLAKTKSEGRAALVGYLPVGYPTVPGSHEALAAMIDGGVDIIEVGVPYSDPVMDGGVIARAADQALRGGVRVRDVFPAVEMIAAAGVAAVVMTYWNPVLKYGVERFSADLANAGGSGLITPNLIPEEASAWVESSTRHGLDRIFLVAPSSTRERLTLTAEASSGFLYVASTMGVTGARDEVSSAAPELVRRVREVSDIPVGVGLGVRSGAQAAEIGKYADAVIVGSALVSKAGESPAAVRELTAELRTALG